MKSKKIRMQDMVLIAIFAAIIVACSFIQIPFGPIPFTLQNFGVFLVAGILGLKRGTLSVITYILLGIIGLPVFRGLGGIGVLAGPTGGFIIGFVFIAIIVGIVADKSRVIAGKKRFVYLIISMLISDALCMALGCVQYKIVASVTIEAAILYTVVPFIITDIVKIVLAAVVILRVKLPTNVE